MTYSKTRATKDPATEYLPTSERHPSVVATVAQAESIPAHTPPFQPPQRDRFAAPEYVNPNARLPRIQALRGENGASECGYFITEAEMAKAGWKELNESETTVYEYNSGVRFV